MKITVEKFDKKFDDNEEDIIQYLDLSSIRKLNQEQETVSLTFPSWMINGLDREASRLGITRQAVVTMWLAERLEQQVSHDTLAQKAA